MGWIFEWIAGWFWILFFGMTGWMDNVRISVWIWAAMQRSAWLETTSTHRRRFHKGGESFFFELLACFPFYVAPSVFLREGESIFEFSRWMRFATHPRGRSSRRLCRTSIARSLAPSCEPTVGEFMWSHRVIAAIREFMWSHQATVWAIYMGNHMSLGNPGGCSGPVRVNLCSCFAEPYLHHEEAICVKPNPPKLLPINHCCHKNAFLFSLLQKFPPIFVNNKSAKDMHCKEYIMGFSNKNSWNRNMRLDTGNSLFAILCWRVAGEPMLFARGSSSWAFVRPIAEYRWGRARIPALLLKTISTMADKCNPTLVSFWR